MSDIDQIDTIPEVLPLIPLRDLTLFPNLVVPLFVGRERSIKALEQAMREHHLVALVTQHHAEVQDPEPGDLHAIGCAASIMQELKLPGRHREGARRGPAALPQSSSSCRPNPTSSCAWSSSRSPLRAISRSRR